MGIAMGTPMAVPAAVIYLARLEEPLLTSNHLIFYKRYIDDIFFIWSGTLSELDSFLIKLNNLAPTIKLSWYISKERAVFKNRFFNRLRNRGYPKWFLSDVFSEVRFDLRWNYLSEKKEKAIDSSHNLFFKPLRTLCLIMFI